VHHHWLPNCYEEITYVDGANRQTRIPLAISTSVSGFVPRTGGGFVVAWMALMTVVGDRPSWPDEREMCCSRVPVLGQGAAAVHTNPKRKHGWICFACLLLLAIATTWWVRKKAPHWRVGLV
jgi:hypothetical protein